MPLLEYVHEQEVFNNEPEEVADNTRSSLKEQILGNGEKVKNLLIDNDLINENLTYKKE